MIHGYWSVYKIHILGRSVSLTCVCFVRINNEMEDWLSLFSSTLCYLYKYLVHQLSYTQVPFHQTEPPEELHAQLLQPVSILSIAFSIDLFRIPALLTIYSILSSRLFPSRGITVSIKLNQFMTRLRGRALHTTHTYKSLIHPYVRSYIVHIYHVVVGATARYDQCGSRYLAHH